MINSPSPYSGALIGDNSIAYVKLAFGSMEKIATGTLAAAATAINFTGLDLATDKLYLLIYNLKGNGGAPGGCQLYVNSDTTMGNYRCEWMTVAGAAIGGSQLNQAHLNDFGSAGVVTGHVFIKLGIGGIYFAEAFVNEDTAADGSAMVVGFSSIRKVAAENVTEINLVADQNMAIGSTAQLYRMA